MILETLLAVSTAVQALLGRPVPELPAKPAERWVQGGPLTLAELRGKVVLIRFFTDAACPYCRASAAALDELERDFASRGLVVIGIYTPKPSPRPTSVSEVRRCVAEYGFEFPVLVDDDWRALRRLWLDRVPDAEYTSASLLLDREGRLAHVHEGGVYAKDAADPQARHDYAALRAAIERLLPGQGEERPRTDR